MLILNYWIIEATYGLVAITKGVVDGYFSSILILNRLFLISHLALIQFHYWRLSESFNSSPLSI